MTVPISPLLLPGQTRGDWLRGAEDEDFLLRVRNNTHTGWPIGSETFLATLEARLDRRLTRLPAGRKKQGDGGGNT